MIDFSPFDPHLSPSRTLSRRRRGRDRGPRVSAARDGHAELLGVPSADNERIHGWSADFAHSLDAVATPGDSAVVACGRAASQALHAYFRNLVGVRRRDPRADLPPGLLAAEEAGDRGSERELLSTCILLYVAGHQTTVSLIGNGLLALLRHRAQWERLVAEPALILAAVKELLRFNGPVSRTGRMPRVEVQIRVYRDPGRHAGPRARGHREPGPRALPGSGPARHRSPGGAGTSPSAGGCTRASGRRWLDWKRRSCWTAWCAGGPASGWALALSSGVRE